MDRRTRVHVLPFPLTPTRHALQRCAERGIPLVVAVLAFLHGRRESARDGLTRHHLARLDAWRASTVLGPWILRWEGVCAVVADGRLVTVFWAPEAEEAVA
jgi:hypothetical protein